MPNSLLTLAISARKLEEEMGFSNYTNGTQEKQKRSREEKILNVLLLIFVILGFGLLIIFMLLITYSLVAPDLAPDIEYWYWIGFGLGFVFLFTAAILGRVQRNLRIRRMIKATRNSDPSDVAEMYNDLASGVDSIFTEKSLCTKCRHMNSKVAEYCEKCGYRL